MLMIYFTDPQMQIWMQRAIDRQKKARAEGTIKNATYTTKEYIRFSYYHGVDPLHPTSLQLCAFTEMLMDRQLAPATVQNKLSHIRTWIRECKGSLEQIDEDMIRRHKDSILRTSKYTPNIKEPVPITVLKSIMLMLPKDNEGWSIRAALLALIYGGFRQSEILPSAKDKFNPETNLTRADVIVHQDQVQFTIKTGKNLYKPDQKRVHVFHSSSNKDTCIVHAIHMVLMITPTYHRDQPMFSNPKDGSPINVPQLRKVWKQSLITLKQDTTKYSLHSVRKTLATSSYLCGIAETEIKEFGAWSSSAYKRYINTKADININKTMTNLMK